MFDSLGPSRKPPLLSNEVSSAAWLWIRKTYIYREVLPEESSLENSILYYSSTNITNMLSFLKSKAGYVSVEDGYEEEPKLGYDPKSPSNFVIIKTSLGPLFLLSILFLSSMISTWIVFFNTRLPAKHELALPASNVPLWGCQRLEHRREWRALREPEKLDYVTAV